MEAQMHRAHGEVPNQTHFHSSGEDEGEQGIKTTALDEDPNAPKDRPQDISPSNYQTKVTDSTGANRAEAGTTPLVQEFEKMSVSDKTRPEKGTEEAPSSAGQGGKSKAGGASIKEYFSEKFKPQDEDKALSQVISSTLFSKQSKDKTEGTGETKPTGKAAESESSAAATAGSGKSGIMDRLKGTATSWFRKGGKAPQTSSVSNVSSEGSAEKEG